MKIKSVAAVMLLTGLMALLPGAARAQNEELTVETVIRISGDLLRVSLTAQQAKMEYARQHPNEREAILERFTELDSWTQTQSEEVYKRYKTSMTDYMAFSAKHRVALQDYLNEHANERAELDRLESQMRELVADLEKVMERVAKKNP